MSGIEHPGRQFALPQRGIDQLETPIAVAKMQMQNAGFPGDQPGNMCIARDS